MVHIFINRAKEESDPRLSFQLFARRAGILQQESIDSLEKSWNPSSSWFISFYRHYIYSLWYALGTLVSHPRHVRLHSRHVWPDGYCYVSDTYINLWYLIFELCELYRVFTLFRTSRRMCSETSQPWAVQSLCCEHCQEWQAWSCPW